MSLIDYILLSIFLGLILWAPYARLVRRLRPPLPTAYSAQDRVAAPTSWPSARTGGITEKKEPIYPVTP